MSTILIIVFVIAGLVFSGSVLLMNPKGGLWFGIGWGLWWWSNEYGSKKSVETSLKSTAQISGIILVGTALILPYILS
jgi:protein translocase SecG subunit